MHNKTMPIVARKTIPEMINTIGIIASILFAFCGAPQAIQCIKQGHAIGISRSFVYMWLVGEILKMEEVNFLEYFGFKEQKSGEENED